MNTRLGLSTDFRAGRPTVRYGNHVIFGDGTGRDLTRAERLLLWYAAKCGAQVSLDRGRRS